MYVHNYCSAEDVEFLTGIAQGYSVQKDPQSARLSREQGNGHFKNRDYAASALFYSQGVCQADPGTEELALCFANRSAALVHLALYKECLADIRRALSNGYPKPLEPKLLARQADCLSQLGGAGEESCLPDRGGTEQLASQTGSIQGPGAVAGASAAVALRYEPSKGRHLVAVEDIAAGEVILEERAYSCVLIPEETVAPRVERRGVAGTEYRHCHHCLRPTLCPLPCQSCSFCRYCGEGCRDRAWEGYHHWECSVGGELLAAGVLAHLALRVALQAGLGEVQRARGQSQSAPSGQLGDSEECGQGAQIKCETAASKDKSGQDILPPEESSDKPEESSHEPPSGGPLIPGCDPAGCYLGSSYLCVHHLLPHTHGHAPRLRFLCAVTLATLCLKLQGSGALASKWGGVSQTDRSDGQSQGEAEDRGSGGSSELSMLGAAALRHVLQLRCNAQAVTAVRDAGVGGSAVQSSAEVRLATAIFPSLSLLNHSCSPNTSISFRSRRVTVRAAQPIRAGQELLHCYGPHRSRMAVRERQRLLQEQYFFLCQCAACCQELGSEGKGHGAEDLGVRCVQCGSPAKGSEEGYTCPQTSCHFTLSLTDLSSRLQALSGHVEEAVRLIVTGRPEKAVKRLQSAITQADRFLSSTHPMQGEIADTMARAYATMGCWGQAAAQLRRSVATVRSQYGEDSVEVGQQLFKLAQLHFNGGEMQKALTVIPKARRLLVQHCGHRSEQVEELKAMEDCLRGVL
ncbi:protein-lysine N-methyltransferase SMYD4 isoform X2 [Amia ocellicauda]|uniref:protein-lysine N-methyltransferase SMYD4 isoform X2 n=1 Tax=Amia ocellicauda TaxID=2972642 RepID=UPI003464D2EA